MELEIKGSQLAVPWDQRFMPYTMQSWHFSGKEVIRCCTCFGSVRFGSLVWQVPRHYWVPFAHTPLANEACLPVLELQRHDALL